MITQDLISNELRYLLFIKIHIQVIRNDPDLLEVSIGSHIRIAREKAGLKQNQLAEMIGIKNKYHSELERGLTCPSFPLMVALSDKLNVSMQFLTKGSDEVSPEVAFPKETLYNIPEAAGFNERRYNRILKLSGT